MSTQAPPRRAVRTTRVLVTGGAGFVGSLLCERLLGEGHDVLCVDDFCTGRRRNIDHLLGRAAFEVMRHDVNMPLAAEVDAIYNLACPASPSHYQRDPVQTAKTAVLGAVNMLELAQRLGARIFQASTSEIYGDPVSHPQAEGDWGQVNPIGPRACYAEGKRCAETLFFTYRRQHGLDVKVARIFNTYGPRMMLDDGRVVSNFVVQALSGQPLTVYGSGEQTRSFCYVDDLIEGILRLMGAEPTFHGPVNLGHPREHTVLELAELVLELTGSRSGIVFDPAPLEDPRRRRPDITLARTHLDWTPRVDIHEGLLRTIEDFDRRLRGLGGSRFARDVA